MRLGNRLSRAISFPAFFLPLPVAGFGDGWGGVYCRTNTINLLPYLRQQADWGLSIKNPTCSEIDSVRLGFNFYNNCLQALRQLADWGPLVGCSFMLFLHYPVHSEFCACKVFSVRRGLDLSICVGQILPVCLQTFRVQQLS